MNGGRGNSMKRTIFLFACSALLAPGHAAADDVLHVVGSSTVAPFSRAAADALKAQGALIDIELTGTNGGMRLFCSGAGEDTPDVANASRRMSEDERKFCAANNVLDVVEFTLGYDGIVLATSLRAPSFSLTPRQLFFALANDTPTNEETCAMSRNRTARWNDVDPSLPRIDIEVYGPPVTSGTRDSFLEHAIIAGAKTVPCLARMAEEDPDGFADYISLLREDGRWIDAGENDHAISKTVGQSRNAIGIFGYSFLVEGRSSIKPVPINNVAPSEETIASGAYPLARALYFYVKEETAPREPFLRPYLTEIFSEEAYAPGGYLRKAGLVPLPQSDAQAMRRRADTLCGAP